MSKRRVVVTSMGAITPLGDTPDELWSSVEAGKSGIGFLTRIPDEQKTCVIGGEHNTFKPEDYMDKKEARRMDRFTQFGMAASKYAYDASGLEGHIDKTRLAVIIGSGAGGLTTIEQQLVQCHERGFHKCSPFLVPMMISDMAAGRVSIALGAKGPNYAVVTACATGGDSIGQAFRMIQYGEVDAVIAGGAEAPITSVSVAGFAACRALSMQTENPEQACRPFDKDRDGFVMAEGGGVLILEELEHAKARGATIHAELIGYGRSSDAYDIVSPCVDGEGVIRAVKLALKDADAKPTDIKYINAHATSTPVGDKAETAAIKEVFGDYAKNGLLMSSTKSMHGHMLGATGAVEAIICLQAMKHNVAPPTINLVNPDEGCDMDYVANKARPVENLDVVMSNSFGFGGHNASLIFKRYVA